MKQYKGLYIDNAIFTSEAEIDAFLEQKAVEAYKAAVQLFATFHDIDHSILADEKAEALVHQHGYTWEQVDEIETGVYKSIV